MTSKISPGTLSIIFGVASLAGVLLVNMAPTPSTHEVGVLLVCATLPFAGGFLAAKLADWRGESWRKPRYSTFAY